MQIGSVWDKNFIFRSYNSVTQVYTPEDISTKTFSLFFKKYKGARNTQKLFNLTNGNGLSVPIYSTDSIRAVTTISAAAEEGQYYWELRRTDLNAPKLYGFADLTFEAQKL